MKNIWVPFLFIAIQTSALAVQPPQTRKEAEALMEDAGRDYISMQASHGRIVQNYESLVDQTERSAQRFQQQVGGLQRMIQSGANPQSLLAATRQMQETQMNFHRQYLQLQREMQNENRAYTAVSNIMKTKHDTVKNSISNIR